LKKDMSLAILAVELEYKIYFIPWRFAVLFGIINNQSKFLDFKQKNNQIKRLSYLVKHYI